MVTIIMSNVIISTARVVIVMFNTYLDDFNLCKFELSTIYDHLFEDVVCKQNELFPAKIVSRLLSWKRVTYSNLEVMPSSALHLYNLKCVK